MNDSEDELVAYLVNVGEDRGPDYAELVEVLGPTTEIEATVSGATVTAHIDASAVANLSSSFEWTAGVSAGGTTDPIFDGCPGGGGHPSQRPGGEEVNTFP